MVGVCVLRFVTFTVCTRVRAVCVVVRLMTFVKYFTRALRLLAGPIRPTLVMAWYRGSFFDWLILFSMFGGIPEGYDRN